MAEHDPLKIRPIEKLSANEFICYNLYLQQLINPAFVKCYRFESSKQEKEILAKIAEGKKYVKKR